MACCGRHLALGFFLSVGVVAWHPCQQQPCRCLGVHHPLLHVGLAVILGAKKNLLESASSWHVLMQPAHLTVETWLVTEAWHPATPRSSRTRATLQQLSAASYAPSLPVPRMPTKNAALPHL